MRKNRLGRHALRTCLLGSALFLMALGHASVASADNDININFECTGSCTDESEKLQPGYTIVHVKCYGQQPGDVGAQISCGSPNFLVSCVPPLGTSFVEDQCDCQFPGSGEAKLKVEISNCTKPSASAATHAR